MKSYFRILVGVLIVWCGIYAVKQAFEGYDLGLMSEFQYIPFVLLIILTVVALRLDASFYKVDKKIYQYAVSFIGFSFFAIVIVKTIQNIAIDNSKTVLKISNLPGATNVLTFDFKDNGKFRLTEFDMLGRTIYYGNYLRSNDTIKVYSSNYNGYAKKLPKIGMIKGDTAYWNNFDTMLVDKNSGVQQ